MSVSISTEVDQLLETVRQNGLVGDFDHPFGRVFRQRAETGPLTGGEYDLLYTLKVVRLSIKTLGVTLLWCRDENAATPGEDDTPRSGPPKPNACCPDRLHGPTPDTE